MRKGSVLTRGCILEGRYEIQSVIGSGGMSTVYLAIDNRLGKRRAIKEIRHHDCENAEVVRTVSLSEAEILKKLDHPSLPRIVDIIAGKQSVIIIMDYIPGRNLQDYLDERKIFDEDKVVAWGIQLTDLLAYLHNQNPPIIYRDMKPSNIMIRNDGTPVLIDFGTAREYFPECKGDTVCLGTRGYAAPEQYSGGIQTDERTDIYGLGVTLYQLLTGHSPAEPPYRIQPLQQIRPYLSAGIEEIINRCTESDPEERYADCEELKYALIHLNENTAEYRRQERRKIVRTGCLFGTALLFMILFFGFGFQEKRNRSLLVSFYLQKARADLDDKEIFNNYEKALDTDPAARRIYLNILDQYVRRKNFSSEDASSVISLVNRVTQKGTCLEILKREDIVGYGEFCYVFGTACFYQIRGKAGKEYAGIWFREAETLKSDHFSAKKKKRAGLYRKICEYYKKLPEEGTESGERPAGKWYRDFYKTLRILNRIKIRENDSDEEIEAGYLISKEVAVEMVQYGERFEQNGIKTKSLQRELDKINERKQKKNGGEEKSRMDIFKEKKTGEEVRELQELLEDAQRKIILLKNRQDVPE